MVPLPAVTSPGLDVAGRRVTVFGMARSGVAAARLLVSRSALVTVVDSQAAECIRDRIAEVEACGAHAVPDASSYAAFGDPELLVVSPGVPAAHPLLSQARRAGTGIIGEIELAYCFCDSPIIAVTGTNGKGTVASLIGDMLRGAGFDAPVAGNIGLPLTTVVDQRHDVVVAEISSFQLETIDRFSPWIAAILNITPDHLDRHPTMDEYVATKSRILENQSMQDFAILNADDPLVAPLGDRTLARSLSVSLAADTADGRLEGDELVITAPGGVSQRICSRQTLPLGGPHNVSNALMAALAASLCGVDVETMAEAIATQRPAVHMLSEAGVVNGVRFVDDSKATNPAAAMADLGAIPGPLVLIAGGDSKGLDLSEFARAAAERAEHIVLIGRSAPEIADAIGDAAPVTRAHDMTEAVRTAFQVSQPGWTVLLAPACASLDMYRNMTERGEVFRGAVAALAESNGL